MSSRKPNRYSQIIEVIFKQRYIPGARNVPFERTDIEQAALSLGIVLPKNIGDILYSFRYRTELPLSIQQLAPQGEQWMLLPTGRSRYAFVSTQQATVTPNTLFTETKIPDATPGIITTYALSDEQALLAKLRYNRLIDIFTGVTCYALQSHLRTTVPDIGQVETDELCVGLDKRGVHYVFPVQAKGGRDSLSIVQITQDFLLCQAKFPTLVCRPIGAQFMQDQVIALFEFVRNENQITIADEKHYRLVQPDQVTAADLQLYYRQTSD